MLASLIPTTEQLKAGIEAFFKKEHRSQAYFKALSHINGNWGIANEMAIGVKILLDSWHNNFYRFGKFSHSALSNCISKNLPMLETLKKRGISTLSNTDEDIISPLFKDFLEALKGGKNNDCRSPVAVAKTMHLLAPNFFPLWDNPIAFAYDTLWGSAYSGIWQYIAFSQKIREVIMVISEYECVKHPVPIRSALKILDEYTYSKFTKHWI
jgi:hypothetical protein